MKLKSGTLFVIATVLGTFVIAGVLGFLLFFTPPRSFVPGTVVIPSGVTGREAAHILKEEKVIRSIPVFELLVKAQEGEVVAGHYYFENPPKISEVVERVIRGDYGIELTQLTVPEGYTIDQLARAVSEAFPHINEEEFLVAAEGLEGYLFPETYRFFPEVTAGVIIKKMREEFDIQIKEIEKDIVSFERSLEDIIIMASIVEEEASEYEDRRMIADVLWRRLDENIPLQVDAAFAYILPRSTYELTREDLEIESPYNTYRNLGLPPTPIANPGIEAIRATVNPKKNSYWYYLADMEGTTYFSDSYDEHIEKRRKYLE